MTLFKPFLLTKCLEKSKNLQFFKKIVLKNSETRFQKGETRFQKGETRFQNAETCFQNAQTALSRIFFARTGMDSAQKKPVTTKGRTNQSPRFTTALEVKLRTGQMMALIG